ncbi:MAG: hypothetical protein K6F86_01890 [Lachnospiraceae bacterium]|nr:hypothetical protein [Lachnospiraceae bacterium]
MKKFLILFLMVMLVFIMGACGSVQDGTGAGEAQSEESAEGTAGQGTEAADKRDADDQTGVDYDELLDEMQKAAVGNPWGDTQALSVAEETAGVKFTPPEEDMLPEGQELQTYRYMEGILEADYSDGENELCIRKSGKIKGQELSGDYNKYGKEWTEMISGIAVTCLGDGELINTAYYDDETGHFAISYNIGQEGKGISVGELQRLIDGKEVSYTFRTPELRLSHFTKHGIDMGFASEEAYEEAASRVITNPKALHKTEAEDGDDVYYVEDTNEFVILSRDGFIRTYFCPDRGKAYYDKQ